jgi:eukaryotic-like serine/threonine-protein kinase
LADQDSDDTEVLPSQDTATVGPVGEWLREQLPEGTLIGPYRVRARIAGGGGGTVYAAERADAPEHKVAIKVLLREKAASPMALIRFQREAEVVGLIHHPNIVPVLDSGSLPDGRPYIVMELVSTATLKSLLERRGRLAPVEMMEILEPICSALSAAHTAGVIHRDLKASNISVGHPLGDAGPPIVRLLDFGIAKLVEADPTMPGLTAKGARLGTPYAMAPEQIRGDAIDQRADIYSLGVLMFHMLTGSYPFSGASPQEIENLHLAAAPPRPGQFAAVPPALEAAVLRCMEKHPAARFSAVDDLLAEVRVAVAGTGAAAPAADVREAVAILVELRPGSEMDDAALAALDDAEQTLRDGGFQLLLQTSTAVLGARPLPPGAAARTELRQQALDLARSLAGRQTPARVCLHAAGALASGERLTGGAIADVASWPLTTTADGIEVSEAATRDLS